MLLRKIRSDTYLKKFISYSKEKFGDNLVAIVIFGSYTWGYFDEKKSDYDVFVIFRDEVPRGKEEIRRKFEKVALHYFCTTDELLRNAHFGHWTSYITLLTSARVLYANKEYEKFLKELKDLNLFEAVIDVVGLEAKANYEANVLRKNKGYKAVKWALPMIRKRLQMLTYVRYHKLIWNLNENLRKNKDLLIKEEIRFMKDLDRRVRLRSSKFSSDDKKTALDILYKINKETILHLASLAR